MKIEDMIKMGLVNIDNNDGSDPRIPSELNALMTPQGISGRKGMKKALSSLGAMTSQSMTSPSNICKLKDMMESLEKRKKKEEFKAKLEKKCKVQQHITQEPRNDKPVEQIDVDSIGCDISNTKHTELCKYLLKNGLVPKLEKIEGVYHVDIDIPSGFRVKGLGAKLKKLDTDLTTMKIGSIMRLSYPPNGFRSVNVIMRYNVMSTQVY